MKSNHSIRRGPAKLLQDIYATTDNEIFCDTATDLIIRCADALYSDSEVRTLYPQLFRHLRLCSNCAAEYKVNMTLARLEAAGQLEHPPVMPPMPGLPRSNEQTTGERKTLSHENKILVVRRIIDLIFQPATTGLVATLGEGSYHTIERIPQIELLVQTTRTAGKQRNYMLLGRLRYEGDQPFSQVESIVLQDIEEPEAPELSTTVDENGTFTLRGLDAGIYRVRILTPSEELILREFKIGG